MTIQVIRNSGELLYPACARRADKWRLSGEVDVSLKFTRGDGLKKGGLLFSEIIEKSISASAGEQ
jgi:hypothetical protein